MSKKSITALATLVIADCAFAATGAAEDNSDFVVWAFIAFCALIVIGQMAPLVKNLRKHKVATRKDEGEEKA